MPSHASEIAIASEAPDLPDVRRLLELSDSYFAGLYPAESNHLVDVATLAQRNVRFLVARRAGVIVGCGAVVFGKIGEAEIKRMFVLPEARGHRLGSRILTALETVAKAEGVRIIRLETGMRQPEALGLYRSHGYTERGPFGSYQPDPLSTFFEKRIRVTACPNVVIPTERSAERVSNCERSVGSPGWLPAFAFPPRE